MSSGMLMSLQNMLLDGQLAVKVNLCLIYAHVCHAHILYA